MSKTKYTLEDKITIGQQYNEVRASTKIHKERGEWRKENYPQIPLNTITDYSKLAKVYSFLLQNGFDHPTAIDKIKGVTPTVIYKMDITDFTIENLISQKKVRTIRTETQYSFYILNFDNEFYKLGVASDIGRRMKEHNYNFKTTCSLEFLLVGSRDDVINLEWILKWRFRNNLGVNVGLVGEETFHPESLEEVMNTIYAMKDGVSGNEIVVNKL